MFEDLHAALSGGKQIQIEQRESERVRRHQLHSEGSPNRDDLDSGTIKITKPRAQNDAPEPAADDDISSDDGVPDGSSPDDGARDGVAEDAEDNAQNDGGSHDDSRNDDVPDDEAQV